MSKTHDEELAIVGGGLLLATLMFARPAARAVVDLTTRGKRLSHSTMVNDVVVESPAALAGEAAATFGLPFSRDVYALMRMVRSEGGSSDEKRLKVHVALNDAKALGWSWERLMTYADNLDLPGGQAHPTANGHYGRQYTNKLTPRAGRRYSTAADPYENDARIVLTALDEHNAGIDPTGGARKFLDKDAMGGGQPGTSSYEAKAAQWRSEGWEPTPIAGTDLVLFHRVA